MRTIAEQILNEPAVVVSIIVGILTAAVAVTAALTAGAPVAVVVGAGLASLVASLGGGTVVRGNVTPVTPAPRVRRPAGT